MPIKTDDGLVLRCDVYRPVKQGKYGHSDLRPLRHGCTSPTYKEQDRM
jgi:hypothetical protein